MSRRAAEIQNVVTRGRRRAFDAARALDAALQVFWRKGYDGASLGDLTGAMGINRPSLYAAFGNKHALFCRVMDRYAEGPAAFVHAALDAPTARLVVERLLLGTADFVSGGRHPRGCLSVHGALASGGDSETARRELASRRSQYQAALRQRFERARSERDLPADADCAALAAFVTAVYQGIAVQAASGTSREELRSVAGLALRAWPDGAATMRRARLQRDPRINPLTAQRARRAASPR